MKTLLRLVVILGLLVSTASLAGAASGPDKDWLSFADWTGASQQVIYESEKPLGLVSWAPDGRSVVYEASNRVIVASPSGEQHTLYSHPPKSNSPVVRWAPDSRRFATISRHTLHLVSLDGSRRAIRSPLIDERSWGNTWLWSGSGRYIAEPSYNENTGATSVLVVDVARGKVTRRTLPRPRDHFNVHGWLGDRLLITCSKPICLYGSLYTIAPAGPARLTLAVRLPSGGIEGVVVSPDGKKLAVTFQQDSDSRNSIWWGRAGKDARRLAINPNGGGYPILYWSPNSRRLLVGLQYDSFNDNAASVATWGQGQLRRLLRFNGPTMFSWAADSRGFYISKRTGNIPGTIYRVDATTGATRLISDLDRLRTVGASEFWVAASPTTDQLVIHTTRNTAIWDPCC